MSNTHNPDTPQRPVSALATLSPGPFGQKTAVEASANITAAELRSLKNHCTRMQQSSPFWTLDDSIQIAFLRGIEAIAAEFHAPRAAT